MLRNGIQPIVTVLDCSKAFDKCKFSLIFQRLHDKGLPPIVTRLLAYIYTEQYGWVKWGSSISSQMSIANGTRQGAILSPFIWAVYADPLLQRLRSLGLGVHIGGKFMGAVCFADDVLLIAPTRSAMQRMLFEMEHFARESNIIFSTDPSPVKSKSKCIFMIGKKQNVVKPKPLKLCGNELPFVGQADHLGHILSEQGDMEQDANRKRAQFIQKVAETKAFFNFAAPLEIIKAVKIYCSAFYGSNLWNLGGERAAQVFKAWNSAVKSAWDCPLWTRSYFVHNLLNCGFSSAKVDILCRFVNFSRGLMKSASSEVQVMARLAARDMTTQLGRNLELVREITGLNPRNDPLFKIKRKLVELDFVEVPAQDKWRVPYLCSLIHARREATYMASDEDISRLNELIDSWGKN